LIFNFKHNEVSFIGLYFRSIHIALFALPSIQRLFSFFNPSLHQISLHQMAPFEQPITVSQLAAAFEACFQAFFETPQSGVTPSTEQTPPDSSNVSSPETEQQQARPPQLRQHVQKEKDNVIGHNSSLTNSSINKQAISSVNKQVNTAFSKQVNEHVIKHRASSKLIQHVGISLIDNFSLNGSSVDPIQAINSSSIRHVFDPGISMRIGCSQR